MLAQPTLLPGSESGGFGQDDVASPVFFAWSKVDRAGELFDQALATLAPIAVRALDVTGRPAPERLRAVAELVTKHFPDRGDNVPMGEDIAGLADAFRARIHAAQP